MVPSVSQVLGVPRPLLEAQLDAASGEILAQDAPSNSILQSGEGLVNRALPKSMTQEGVELAQNGFSSTEAARAKRHELL